MPNPQSILLVEDDDLLAQLIAELLRGAGYQVWAARNGLDGYLSYYRYQTAIVVTDIEMPELDGFEMMRCIRAINPYVNTIYMSGATKQYRGSLLAEAQQFGAAIVRKPFAGTHLLKLIAASCGEPARIRSSAHYQRLDSQSKLAWKEAVDAAKAC
jgi:CheY-like chemotaxis protein